MQYNNCNITLFQNISRKVCFLFPFFVTCLIAAATSTFLKQEGTCKVSQTTTARWNYLLGTKPRTQAHFLLQERA